MNTMTQLSASWLPERSTVLENARCGPDWYRLRLRAPQVARSALAGHFIHCSVRPVGAPGSDLLFKRPFSLCQIRPQEGWISVIYRAGPGRGTLALTGVAPGQELDLLGPLGRSFPEPGRLTGRRLALVGGGIGIPPLVAGAEWALACSGVQVSAICAARSGGGLSGIDEMRATGVEVTVMTDDGSAGRRGLATDPLAEWLRAGRAGEVWACGPEPMLAQVQDLCAGSGVACWLAVERRMACGVGVCMTCTIPVRQPTEGNWYRKCCTDGPVFPGGEVVLGE